MPLTPLSNHAGVRNPRQCLQGKLFFSLQYSGRGQPAMGGSVAANCMAVHYAKRRRGTILHLTRVCRQVNESKAKSLTKNSSSLAHVSFKPGYDGLLASKARQ